MGKVKWRHLLIFLQLLLGFKPTKASKGWYTDGHERPDVVEFRTEFISKIIPKLERMVSYNGDNCELSENPILNALEKEFVLITHDEVTFYSNEGKSSYWMENGKKKLSPKWKGSSIMISGFVCQCHGFFKGLVKGIEKKSYLYFFRTRIF